MRQRWRLACGHAIESTTTAHAKKETLLMMRAVNGRIGTGYGTPSVLPTRLTAMLP